MEIEEIILQLSNIQKKLEASIRDHYYNTQPVLTTGLLVNNKIVDLQLYLQDLLLIGAITQSSLLLSGSSGSGKTYLAELVLERLFGPAGFTRKNITPDMNEQDFMDIDFGAIKAGKRLKDALLADELFNRPSLIIDEANRAPPIIQNRLMQVLENNIDLKSKTFRAGKLLEDGSHYQWIILTLNLGAEYAGTSAIDRALKDRITIDIPIDNFPPTIDDQIRMIRAKSIRKPGPSSPEETGSKSPAGELVDVKGNLSEDVFEIYQHVEDVQLNLDAEALLLYLSFCSGCVKSPTRSKYGVTFSPTYCKEQQCKYARNPPLKDFCPFIFSPSNRVLRKVVLVAKGLYLVKQAVLFNRLLKKDEADAKAFLMQNPNREVGINEIIEIAPFILHSKIAMNRELVVNKFNGNTFLAIKHVLKVINGQLNKFMKEILPALVQEMRGESLNQKDTVVRKRLLEEDFHLEGLIKYVEKYLELGD
ncbi:AAA domain-containing protein [Candidatus Bathyarchaeota archaeon]|nr:AAA domain-containing protein [Candidatus Bathyarchaeota archaeon]